MHVGKYRRQQAIDIGKKFCAIASVLLPFGDKPVVTARTRVAGLGHIPVNDLAEQGFVGIVIFVCNRFGEFMENNFCQPGRVEGFAEEGCVDGSDLPPQLFEDGNRA